MTALMANRRAEQKEARLLLHQQAQLTSGQTQTPQTQIIGSPQTPQTQIIGSPQTPPTLPSFSTSQMQLQPVALHFGSPPSAGPVDQDFIGPPGAAPPKGITIHINVQQTKFCAAMDKLYPGPKYMSLADAEIWKGPIKRIMGSQREHTRYLEANEVKSKPFDAFSKTKTAIVGNRAKTAIAMQYCIEPSVNGEPALYDLLENKAILDGLFLESCSGRFYANPGYVSVLS